MTASFRKIDYSLRPAKHAERRMLCEVFRRLAPFQPVEDYAYVGLGSLWFSDFILFHRALGVREMVSIEDKDGGAKRFEANKPFRSITLKHGSTSKALPKLNWERRQFIWLDYDDQLDLAKLLDLQTVAARAVSGTLLAVSVQCEAAKEIDEALETPETPALDRFRDRFGRTRVSPEVWADDLVSWRFGALSRIMLLAEIASALGARNADGADEISFHPICEIEYSDGAKMTTIVGVFVSKSQLQILEACGFGKLDFLPPKGQLVKINVPKLTAREIRRLEQQLPRLSGGGLGDLGGIPRKDAEAFAALYRYLPNFAILEN